MNNEATIDLQKSVNIGYFLNAVSKAADDVGLCTRIDKNRGEVWLGKSFPEQIPARLRDARDATPSMGIVLRGINAKTITSIDAFAQIGCGMWPKYIDLNNCSRKSNPGEQVCYDFFEKLQNYL